MAIPGLGGRGLSLRAVNFPDTRGAGVLFWDLGSSIKDPVDVSAY